MSRWASGPITSHFYHHLPYQMEHIPGRHDKRCGTSPWKMLITRGMLYSTERFLQQMHAGYLQKISYIT